MKRYRVAVCRGPDCRRNGADAVFVALKEVLEARGLSERCELYRGGCYGLCHVGANVVVREHDGKPRDPLSRADFQLLGIPGEQHYAGVRAYEAPHIVDSHIAKDEPVEEMLGKNRAGGLRGT
jgi:(2Fe-2S) ferredoxin